MARKATLWGMGNLPTRLDATPAGTGGMTMNCDRCGKPDTRHFVARPWSCYNGDGEGWLCDDCRWEHEAQCPRCEAAFQEDQALLVAWQLGKDRVDELWTADDEAALLLTDRSRRAYQQWAVEVGW